MWLACAASTAIEREHRHRHHQADDHQHRHDADTRRRGSRSAGASWPSDSRPENASQAAANPRRRLRPVVRRHLPMLFHSAIQCSSAAPAHSTATTSATLADQRRQRHRQRHARQLAHADPVQRPEQQDRGHRQHRDLVRERPDHRDVVQRRHHRDGDGQQVGADHQRARDDADARAERLGRRRHPTPALRIAMRDLQVLERPRTRTPPSRPGRTSGASPPTCA